MERDYWDVILSTRPAYYLDAGKQSQLTSPENPNLKRESFFVLCALYIMLNSHFKVKFLAQMSRIKIIVINLKFNGEI